MIKNVRICDECAHKMHGRMYNFTWYDYKGLLYDQDFCTKKCMVDFIEQCNFEKTFKYKK